MTIRATRAALSAALCLMLATPAPAQEAEAAFDFAGDRFLAGDTVDAGDGIAGDLFAAGERIGVDDAIGASAHLAARKVALSAPVAGDLYAAGMDIVVDAPVAGRATLMGYDVTVSAPVEGNLRAFARHVALGATLGGGLLVGADRLELSADIAGDADITAREITFGEDARIGGTLTLRGLTEAEAGVPEGLAAEVRYLPLPDEFGRDGGPIRIEIPGVGEILQAALVAFAVGVLIVAALGLVAASLVPHRTADAVERSFEQPGGTLWAGIVTLSLILGGALVLALTGIGALALPVLLLLAGLLGAAGYVMGAYALGARILAGPPQQAPDRFGPRAGAALLGAGIAGLLGLIPFLGWLVLLAVSLFGIGLILPARAAMGPVEV